jgi:lysozyme family protein
MIQSFFEGVAFPWVFGEEGGYTNDPKDRGNWTSGVVGVGVCSGTKYGISAAQYPSLDIKNITPAIAMPLVKNDYWDAFNGDQIPAPIALCVLDFAVNAGVKESVKVLQRTLGLVQDGDCGIKTQAACRVNDSHFIARKFTDEREFVYSEMSEFPVDGKGWDNRARATLAKALSL